MNELEIYAEKEGFKASNARSSTDNSAMGDMFNFVYKELEQIRKNLNPEEEAKSSVCTTVTVKFSQKTTMTREAFEGTLIINNALSGAMKDVALNFTVLDEDGKDMSHLFQINIGTELSGIGSIDGKGFINGGSSASIVTVFIPTKEAAPTLAKSYQFTGSFSYFDEEIGERVTNKLYPVTLEVHPSPDLVLHYFMQRDILGDDALTEDVVEPMVPAEMSLLIHNEGYGAANKVQVESMQPEIIDNKQGLLIDFEMIGSNLNNEPKELGLLKVDFGTIEPQKSMVGQWWFTSTLLGHFVKYDINVVHKSSYGNKNLSLIKTYQLHELIKSVKAYGLGQDDIADFLVNDIADMYDTPDRIYYSNGESDEVIRATNANASNSISSSQLTTKLTIDPSFIGWNYENINDPGSNLYKLVRVVRESDKLELPIENFWQTHVTLRDGKDPKYENKLHFVDKVTTATTYTLYYKPKDLNLPKVVSFKNVVEGTTTKQVEHIQVNFNKPIDVNSFTTEDIQLIYQGEYVSTDDILIAKIDDTTYSLNIKALTLSSGRYELIVQAAGIKDLLGNEGEEGKNIVWI